MKKKVILIEDDPTLAHALELRLKSTGYATIHARSIATGLSLIVKRKPDVTLIDINLPDGSGFSLAEQIQSNPNCPNTPVIFITASKDPRYIKRAQKYSPIAFLEKPFDTSELIDAIEYAQYASGELSAFYKRKRY